MPRSKMCRRISGQPKFRCFKPNAQALSKLESILLEPDEFEALRLADHLSMQQKQAAEQMQVSRQTFGNIIKSARKKVATSLIEGKALYFTKES